MFYEQQPNIRKTKRVSNGANVNNYLITIPRCDLPKKFIFDGLVNICERLVVSKEKHTLTYLDSCCKNSSIKLSSLENVLENPSLNEESRPTTSSQQALNEKHAHLNRFTQQNVHLILDGENAIRTNTEIYKKQKTTPNNNNNTDNDGSESTLAAHSSQGINSQNLVRSDLETSFMNDTFFETRNDEWIHCKSHIHIFAEFDLKLIIDFNKCKKIMEWCTNGLCSNIEPCKSPKNAIIYVTKEDEKPLLKNINQEEVAFHKKMMDWIKANPEFSYFDPFICSRPNLYNLIVLAHSNYYKENPIQYQPCRGLSISNLDCNKNQTKLTVQKWYNESITNWHVKFPALYLWGESNTGKTTIIFDWLLSNQVTENQIFRPARNCQFAWADFNVTKHLIVVMDEFDFTQFDIEEWKNIVEGRYTSIRVKGKSSRTIALRCPIIMISNHRPPVDKPEISNRIKIVQTVVLSDKKLY